jgi:hypothetical protein
MAAKQVTHTCRPQMIPNDIFDKYSLPILMNVATIGQHTQCSSFLCNFSMMANIVTMEHQGMKWFL